MPTTRFTRTLAATAVGVYLLLVVGATAALADAAAACGGWPLCGPGRGTTFTPEFAIAVGHRIVAAFVGVLVLATAVLGYRAGTSRRVKGALLAAVALYPAQVLFGAFVAVTDAPALLSAGHLLLAVGIFGSLVLALAWQLERETGTDDDTPVSMPEADLPDEVPPAPTPTYDSFTERARATVWAYFQLTKPRLMWLLCLVASAGMALAAGANGLGLETVLYTLGGGVLAIGASGTFNHVLERDVDRKMDRTSDRPLATHEVPVPNALVFGVTLGLLSLVAFWQVNLLAAVLGLTAIVFYSVIYTLLLKPNTVQNTVIGGAAGALPALIGWVAVTGNVGLGGFVLASVIFMWTPAHFYNLALAYKDDYARGGFPMMPVVRGETETRKHIIWWLGATLITAAGLAVMDALGLVYVVTSLLLGGVFLYFVVRLHYEQDDTAAFRAFHASNAYLGMLLLAIVVDTLAV